MKRVTGNRLLDLEQEGSRIADKQIPYVGALRKFLLQNCDRDRTMGSASCTRHRLNETRLCMTAKDSKGALASDIGGLDSGAKKGTTRSQCATNSSDRAA